MAAGGGDVEFDATDGVGGLVVNIDDNGTRAQELATSVT
jgi:hypothetical protein